MSKHVHHKYHHAAPKPLHPSVYQHPRQPAFTAALGPILRSFGSIPVCQTTVPPGTTNNNQ